MSLRIYIAALVAGVAASASAQTHTWTGTAGDGLWSTNANWLDGARPVSSTLSTIDLTQAFFPIPTTNDLGDGVNVGTLKLGVAGFRGNTLVVNAAVIAGPESTQAWSYNDDLKLQLAGDVAFTSSFPAGQRQATPIGRLTGPGTATFHGHWQVTDFSAGGMVIAPDGALTTYSNSTPVALNTFNVAGVYDVNLTVDLPAGQLADLSAAVVNLGQGTNTLGAPVAGRAGFTGDMRLGRWVLQAVNFGNDLYGDRIDVGGTLDLRNSDVDELAYFSFASLARPDYFVLATYGNRIGTLDISTLSIGSTNLSGPSGLTGEFPIIYTSAENSGPGEIRVMLPEPSSLLTLTACALLARRCRRQSHA